jgi:hypothetical protein
LTEWNAPYFSLRRVSFVKDDRLKPIAISSGDGEEYSGATLKDSRTPDQKGIQTRILFGLLNPLDSDYVA